MLAHGPLSTKSPSGQNVLFHGVLAQRRWTILVDYINFLREAFRYANRLQPFAIDAIVILPDHLHAIMTLPPGDCDFSGRWRRIKSGFTRRVVATGIPVARDKRREYQLWQRRFWEHTIRDEEDFERHVDYIHYNPVKYGLVLRVSNWPHSSFHNYVRQGLLPLDWAGSVNTVTSGFGERRG